MIDVDDIHTVTMLATTCVTLLMRDWQQQF